MVGRGRRRREGAGAGAGGKRTFTTNKVIILLIQIKRSACFKIGNREKINRMNVDRKNVNSATPK